MNGPKGGLGKGKGSCALSRAVQAAIGPVPVSGKVG